MDIAEHGRRGKLLDFVIVRSRARRQDFDDDDRVWDPERAEIGGGRRGNQRVGLERGARRDFEPSSHRGKRGTAGPRVERLPLEQFALKA